MGRGRGQAFKDRNHSILLIVSGNVMNVMVVLKWHCSVFVSEVSWLVGIGLAKFVSSQDVETTPSLHKFL